ncbi:protein argonaute [Fervidobacterium sp.]
MSQINSSFQMQGNQSANYPFPMNIFKLRVPTRVKRIYYYNPNTKAELFAENLSRVNHLHFFSSNDLVWVELPDMKINIFPLEVAKYELDKKELIENDERLFIKTINSYITKLFLENGYIQFYKKNEFVYPIPAGNILNGQINYHNTYSIRTVKLNDEWYLVILPGFKFFSSTPAINSKARGSLTFNMKTGKTFQVTEIDNDHLKIIVNSNVVEIRDLEAYYFTYTSTDAEGLGIFSEMQKIHKEKLPEELKKLDNLLFLDTVVQLNSRYLARNETIFQNFYFFQFKEGDSNKVNDVFKLHPLHTEEKISFALYFKSKEHAKELRDNVQVLFHPNGTMTKALLNLGIRNIEFLKNPKDGSNVFTYDERTFQPNIVPDISNGKKNVVALIFLERFYGNILPIIKNFPQNMILMPVLNKTIIDGKVYTINSFAYKIVNFLSDKTLMYYLKVEPGTLFIGIDLAQDVSRQYSDVISSSVDYLGKVLRIAVRKNLPLTEKADVKFIEDEIGKTIEKFHAKFGMPSKRVILFRDGKFIEEPETIEEILKARVKEYALIEIKKDTLYNSHYNLQDKVVKLSDNVYIYFPKSYLKQKGVEVNIYKNETSQKNDEIAKLTYLSTLLHHPSPYMTIRLPYPLYINDKIGKVGGEWKFYIPYFI